MYLGTVNIGVICDTVNNNGTCGNLAIDSGPDNNDSRRCPAYQEHFQTTINVTGVSAPVIFSLAIMRIRKEVSI